MFKKRILSILVAMLMIVPFGAFHTFALSEEEISAPSAILMEPETKKVLFEKNAHEIRACASITKVMTLVLVFEAIEDGKLDYTDIITSSEHAASMGGSDIWLEKGEQMTADDMIKAVVVASANDAAVALAEAICGTEEEFVAKMNEKAKALGMNDTTFKNCNGLDEEGHLTSAYDVAIMSSELIRHEKIFDYSTIWIDYLRGGETQIVNTNKLLKSYKGIKGLKTGTTSQAGSCMSAVAERDNMTLVAVVLGCDTGTGRFSDSAKLLDYGFANYMIKELTLPGGSLAPLKVKSGMETTVTLKSKTSSKILLPKSGKTEIDYKIEIPEEIEAPVKEGEKIGRVQFYSDSATLDEFEVFTGENVEKITFFSAFKFLISKLFSF
ncbi:MAG: D-alanyl-D-alanine carboxypeptidase [Ruminococcaceae bacterium]|nr:D-alanyl-D-alanine carboxypeptidase [Oscillospiraceae bacterium]